MFIEMMQKGSGDPKQLIGMLATVTRQVGSMPIAPAFVKDAGDKFAMALDAWMRGEPSATDLDVASAEAEAAS